MTSRRIVVIILAYVCLVLAAISILAVRRQIEISGLIAANEIARGQLAAEIAGLEKRRMTVVPTRPPDAIPPVISAPPPPQPRTEPTKPRSLQSLVDADPMLANLYLRSQRARYGQDYGAFFQSLNLSNNAIERLKDIKLAAATRLMDTAAALKKVGGASGSLVSELEVRLQEQSRADEIALLGQDGFDRLQEYERTLPVRSIVAQFCGLLSPVEPLSGEQTEQLIRITAGSSEQYSAGGKADWLDIDWAALDANVQPLLTARQFSLWKTAEPGGGGPSRWMAEVWTRTNGRSTGPH